MLDALWDQITVSTRTSLATTDSGSDVAEDHRKLMSAIREGDPDRAASAAREHVLRTLAMNRSPSDPSKPPARPPPDS